jgi:formylmethanofuran dehydrogenase subunit B
LPELGIQLPETLSPKPTSSESHFDGARIDGRAVSLEEAILAAASLLLNAKYPIISGTLLDVHASRAAIELAERCDAIVDFADSDATFNTLTAIQRAGIVCETIAEIRFRADVVILIGDDRLLNAMPRLGPRILDIPASSPLSHRRVVLLGNWSRAAKQSLEGSDRVVTSIQSALPLLPNSLNGLLGPSKPSSTEIASLIGGASNLVVVWNPEFIATADRDLWTETLLRWISKSNRGASCAALPLAGRGITFQQVCTWLTGFPGRVRFQQGTAEYDPYRFRFPTEPQDLATDCLLWVEQDDEAALPVSLPNILLTAPRNFRTVGPYPKVEIAIGLPGVDHESIQFRSDSVDASICPQLRDSTLPSAGKVLDRIVAALFQAENAIGQHPGARDQ